MPKRQSRVPVTDDESDQYDDEISAFHRDRDKILLDSDDNDNIDKEPEEEEVFPLLNNDYESSSDDDEEVAFMKRQLRQIKRNKFSEKHASDLEDEEEQEEDVRELRGWGDKKRSYYGGDVRGNRIDIDDEDGRAVMELEEGLKIAKRHTDLMTDEDFMLPKSTKAKKENKGQKENSECLSQDVEKIQMDFSKLSKKETIKMMEKLYPGYIPLVNDFNAKATELKDCVLPLMSLLKKNQLNGPGAGYIKLRYHIISNYLTLGAFYMYLVEKREPDVNEHPVIRRLLQFQQFYNRLVPVNRNVEENIDTLLTKIKDGEDVGVIETAVINLATNKKRKTKTSLDLQPKKRKKENGAEFAIIKAEDSGDEIDVEKDVVGEENLAVSEEEERRGITYQMEKNKGYMTNKAPKKKEKRNPRVKHRTKFRRANIRRKGQVRDFKPPVNMYKGEATGIRAGIIRSRKLK